MYMANDSIAVFHVISASRLTCVLRWICVDDPTDSFGETLSATDSLLDALCEYATRLWSFTGVTLQRSSVRFQSLTCHQLEYIFHEEKHIAFVRWYSCF